MYFYMRRTTDYLTSSLQYRLYCFFVLPFLAFQVRMSEQQLKAVSRALLTSQVFKSMSTPCHKLQIDAQIRNRLKLITEINDQDN